MFPFQSDPVIDLIGTIAVAVGLVFLSLALLTFFLCRRNPRVTNTARINLCISLLLALLLFLLTQKFLSNRHTQQVSKATIFGVRKKKHLKSLKINYKHHKNQS